MFMPLPPFLQKTWKWTLVIGNRLANIQLIPSIFLCLKNNLNTTPPFLEGSVEQCVYARIPKLSSELFPNTIWHRCVSAIRKIPANKLPTPIKKVRVQLTPSQISPKLQTQLVCTGLCCDCHPCLALPGSWKGPWKKSYFRLVQRAEQWEQGQLSHLADELEIIPSSFRSLLFGILRSWVVPFLKQTGAFVFSPPLPSVWSFPQPDFDTEFVSDIIHQNLTLNLLQALADGHGYCAVYHNADGLGASVTLMVKP